MMFKREHVLAIAVSGLLATASPALAQETGAVSESPAEIVEEIVEDGNKGEDGATQPSTGQAKPVENWFGCKPENDKDHCDSAKNQEQADASN